jgi:hypothetical protein
MIVYKRNYISYGDKLLTQSLFNDTSKIFSKHHVYRLVNTIRNYFGEYISFYFLWCTSFCNWMLLPSLIGFLVFIVGANQDEILQNYEIKTIKKLTLNTYDIFLIILCIFITIWAMLFLKVWRQNEQLFSYFWGMENYEKIEPLNGNFTPNKTYDFLFGEKIKVFSTVSSNFRRFVSYIVLGMMIIIRLVSVHYIYKIKNKEKYSQSLKWNIIFGCITGLTLKLMSILYEFIANDKLTDVYIRKNFGMAKLASNPNKKLMQFYENLFDFRQYKPIIVDLLSDDNMNKLINIISANKFL